jgi:hypothetical protein
MQRRADAKKLKVVGARLSLGARCCSEVFSRPQVAANPNLKA